MLDGLGDGAQREPTAADDATPTVRARRDRAESFNDAYDDIARR